MYQHIQFMVEKLSKLFMELKKSGETTSPNFSITIEEEKIRIYIGLLYHYNWAKITK